MHQNDTIVAVSSPPGRSARGLLRISGPQTQAIMAALVCKDDGSHRSPGDGDSPALPAVRIARRLHIARLSLPSSTGPLPLPALLTYFAAPRTYTGQDLAEIQIPGNPALLDRLLHAVIARGARLAEPGEFTFRAFLAGKLDLTQAEGVAATIAAVSDSQLRAASALREGKLATMARQFVDEVGNALALVEAGIDFTDQDDVVPISPGELHTRVTKIAASLDDVLTRSRSWGSLEALPRVVLVGEPSTGKSTLFNALLGRQRAVISETPGTTRDVLCEPLTLVPAAGGAAALEIMLVDLAGLDEPRHFLDRAMQDAARQATASADLALIIDDGRGLSPSPAAVVPAQVPMLHVRTKADVESAIARVAEAGGSAQAPERTPTVARSGASADSSPGHPDAAAVGWAPPTLQLQVLAVSAHTGAGLSELRAAITRALSDRAVSVAGEAMALQPRHELALRQAREAIAAAIALLAPQRADHAIASIELVAGSLRRALDELAGLGGTLTPDDVIGRVFATFCVGK